MFLPVWNLELFQFSERDRDAVRKKYNIGNNEVLIVYLGKFGGMYMEQETFDFFNEISFFEEQLLSCFVSWCLHLKKKKRWSL